LCRRRCGWRSSGRVNPGPDASGPSGMGQGDGPPEARPLTSVAGLATAGAPRSSARACYPRSP
jgi:hypothetical protein